MKSFYLHLVSDATGSTLHGVVDACLSQFSGLDPIERFWPLIRSDKQLDRVIDDLRENPGPVFYTIIDTKIRDRIRAECMRLSVPCFAVLDPLIDGLADYFKQAPKGEPGLQHLLDDAYFRRMDAVDFALTYDDGQSYDGIERADVILVGVSRTSKTPTCIYLARQGIRAANIPLVPGVTVPDSVLSLSGPLYVGLVESPERLVTLRRTRLRADGVESLMENRYLDEARVEEEIRDARRLFARKGWTVIDVTRRSVEETAAEIQMLLQRRKEKKTNTQQGKRA
jgi:regulator of PEP synthase PpsR (kinase-PPPase family)